MSETPDPIESTLIANSLMRRNLIHPEVPDLAASSSGGRKNSIISIAATRSGVSTVADIGTTTHYPTQW